MAAMAFRRRQLDDNYSQVMTIWMEAHATEIIWNHQEMQVFEMQLK